MAKLSEDQIDFLLSFTTDTFNTRLSNVLFGEHVFLNGQLLSLTENDLRLFVNMGTKGINDIKEVLLENGFDFDSMDYDVKAEIANVIKSVAKVRDRNAERGSGRMVHDLFDRVQRYDFSDIRKQLAEIEIGSGEIVSEELEPTLQTGDTISLKEPLDAPLSNKEKEQLADCTRAFTGLHPCGSDFKKVVEAVAENPSARKAFRRFASYVDDAHASVPENKIA